MKKVYVVTVRWYEDGKWYNTNLHVFSNHKSAQSYVDWKNEHLTEKAISDRSEYQIEEYPLWSKDITKN